MRRGLWVMAAASTVIPLLGFLGVVAGIVESFGPVVGEKSAIMRGTISSVAGALHWFLWSLALAVPLLCVYRRLDAIANLLDKEMRIMTLELLSVLSR